MKRKIIVLILSAICLNIGFANETKQDSIIEKYRDSSVPIEERIEDLLKRMTIEEKIDQMSHIHSGVYLENGKVNFETLKKHIGDRSLGFIEAFPLTGKECEVLMKDVQKYMRTNSRLGIPIFTVSESLHGSVHNGSTIFPQTIALGSTFNLDLAYEMTSVISKELECQGIIQTFSPGLDVCRDLRWGRVEESFSEDPFLVSRMSVSQVSGYLDSGISPMLKPIGAHGAPTGGLNLASVSCSERDLLSIFLKPYEVVVKEVKPWAVMSSYNSWNNIPNSSSYYLLTELLRNQWGFQGYVYSDWGAVSMLRHFHKTAYNDADAAKQALMAGLDAEASSSCYLRELKNLVEADLLDIKYIDQAVTRILRAKFQMGMFDDSQKEPLLYDEVVHSKEHIALSRKIAEESIILMKNENNILPLDVENLKSIAVVGPNADQVQFGDYTWSRSNDDGVTFLHALKERFGNKIQINYAKGCDLTTDNREGFKEAFEATKKSDITVVVVGSASASLARNYKDATCGEGFDLSDLDLTGVQEDLIKDLYSTGRPIIVVLLAGKPFSIPWVKENIPGIVVQWYPGEQGGYALTDMLFGDLNPSGKLNFSFPQSVGHLPCHYSYLPTDKGYYKSPGSKNKPGKDYVFSSPKALWSFGHGLSYTSFDYLKVDTSKEDYNQGDTIEVRVTVKNTGNMDGKEVVQIYVRDIVSSVVTPIHELKGFEKVLIKQGDTKDVKILIPVSLLSLYNRDMNEVVEPGDFEIQVGSASDNILLRKMISVEKNKEQIISTAKKVESNVSKIADVKTITVSGVIRDVQSNPMPSILVKVGKKQARTNEKGYYKIKALSSDVLNISGRNIRSQEIKISGRTIINIDVINK